MKLWVILLSVIFALNVQSNSNDEDSAGTKSDNDGYNESELMTKSHLACISHGLKKLGKPAPDENYLAMLGLMVRENVPLFKDEVIPDMSKMSDKEKKKVKLNRRGLDTGEGIEASAKGRDDLKTFLSAKAQYQKQVMKMILAGGYCKTGSVKNKNTKFDNYYSVLNSIDPSYKEAQLKARKEALAELGYDRINWATSRFEEATAEFLPQKEGKVFSSLPTFKDQVSVATEHRKKLLSDLSSGNREPGTPRVNKPFQDCLAEIDSAPEAKVAEARATCEVLYDTCGIAVAPESEGKFAGATHRPNAKGQMLRVGGNWCAQEYPTPLKKDSEPSVLTMKDIAPDKVPKAPSEVASGMKPNGRGNLVSVEDGTVIDPAKIRIFPNGYVWIPADAIFKKGTAAQSVILPGQDPKKVTPPWTTPIEVAPGMSK